MIEKREKEAGKGSQSRRSDPSRLKPSNFYQLQKRVTKIEVKPVKANRLTPEGIGEEVIRAKTDIYQLVKKMNFLEVLRKASLFQHHRRLVPLVLLSSKKQLKAVTKSDNLFLKNQSKTIGRKRKFREYQQVTNMVADEWEKVFEDPIENKQINLSDFERIYLRLKQIRSKMILKDCLQGKLFALCLLFLVVGLIIYGENNFQKGSTFGNFFRRSSLAINCRQQFGSRGRVDDPEEVQE